MFEGLFMLFDSRALCVFFVAASVTAGTLKVNDQFATFATSSAYDGTSTVFVILVAPQANTSARDALAMVQRLKATETIAPLAHVVA
jgi:hypothetical protein